MPGPGAHALLSPSSSERWIHCPPSARLCEDIADTGSPYAAEGTEAHALCEYLLKKALGDAPEDPRPTLEQYTQEMQDCAEGYVQYVLEQAEAIRKQGAEPVVYVEQKLDMSGYAPECHGTSDAVIVGGGLAVVCDFKYGMTKVPATSSQLKLYALGVCDLLGCIYEIDRVKMVIFQPRIGSVDEHEMTSEALYTWARDILEPAAKLAWAGDGKTNAGDWCKYCRIKHQCRTLAKRQMELARYEFRAAALLSDAETADVLSRVDELVSWANGVKEYALGQAISGKRYPGWKLVEGRSNRRYTDEAKAVDAAIAAGWDPWERSVRSITTMEKLMGKKTFGDVLGAYVEKPRGKPTLVSESDKRPEWNDAKSDFSDTTND